ncbi:S-adenosyl-L-methionine-dependent methyltransferase [Parasponia andersonii]|uniref:S-adenosyl-L-methionine-dependent methyltransferase n=1 Tax=Parasponia andersonii TaxID=3476 RepID=A0A2P5BR53_PARAD|nr:S-adenosyl-L-methionine-dependent methyltransferase [Parasponia andersonii]
MAVLRNNTVFPRHESYGGGQSWAASSSSFLCMVSVSGLWWSNIRPVPIKCSTSTQAWRGSHCRSLWSSASNPSFSAKQTPKANAEKHVQGQRQQDEEDDEEEEEYQVLTSIRSQYNDIMILDTAKSRVLLLDSSHNVHSILYKHQNWTNAYWDEFASLPPIVPKGPIAILGLGAGTAAHLMLDLWPELQLKGWEIDQILIYQAREYFGLSDLEKHTKAGGNLTVHIGDALSPSVKISGGYAGIVVDLFSNGEVLPQLQEGTYITPPSLLVTIDMNSGIGVLDGFKLIFVQALG